MKSAAKLHEENVKLRAENKKLLRQLNFAYKTISTGLHRAHKLKQYLLDRDTDCRINAYRFKKEKSEAKNNIIAVTCCICGNETPKNTAHVHQGKWIGDNCCWDEQLRSSE